MANETPPPAQPEPRGYRSLFWPVVLIGGGLIWLLINLGVLQPGSLITLFRLWPLLLILLGVDLIIGRRSPVLSAGIGLATVALGIALLFAIPPESLPGNPGVRSGEFSEPVDGAERAVVELDLSQWRTTVEALPAGSDSLIEADLDYVGDIVFEATGSETRTVTLAEHGDLLMPGLIDWAAYGWEIGLSREVPLELTVSGGSGSSQLDLSDLLITGLAYDGGSGRADIILPATGDQYEAAVSGGSGSVTIDIAGGAEVALTTDSGSGSFTINVNDGAVLEASSSSGSGSVTFNLPADAGARVEVLSSGSGSIRVAGRFDRVSDGGDDDDDTGVWETPGFGGAEAPIVIRIRDAGSGSVTIN